MYSSFLHSIWPIIVAVVLFIAGAIFFSSREEEAEHNGEDTFPMNIGLNTIFAISIALIAHCLLVRHAGFVWDYWYVTLAAVPISFICFLIPGGFLILNAILSGAGLAVIPVGLTITASVVAALSVALWIVIIVLYVKSRRDE